MQRVLYPYSTTTTGISVFDRDNQYRPLQWDQASNEIDWLNREDNGQMLTLLDRLPVTTNSLTNPIINWTEDERLENASNIKTGGTMTASSTTLNLDDNYIATKNQFVVAPSTGEIMEVTTVDYTNGHTVTRGMNGTAGVALAVGDAIIALPNYMAEQSDPRAGVGRLPGTAQYNFISLISKTFKVTKVQNASMVYDNWGQVPKASIDTILDIRRELSYGLLFQARATYATADEGQMYIGQGLFHYIKDGMLDLGQYNSNLTWPILNAWLEERFAPDASSQQKILLAGLNLFSAGQKMMRDMGRMEAGSPYFEPSLATNVYRIRTDGGFTVEVILDKYGLSSKTQYGLGDWGFLIDTAHISGGQYADLGFQWFQNIQDNRSVMLREDAYMGSFCLIVKHQGCHGVIRGAGRQIVDR